MSSVGGLLAAKERARNNLYISACLFVRLLRCRNSYRAGYALVSAPLRQTKILSQNVQVIYFHP